MSGKMVKSLEFFFLQSYIECLLSEIVFVLVKSYSILTVCLQCILKKALFLPFLRSILNTFLVTLSPKKESIVLEEKIRKKPRTFDPKIFTNPVWWISGLKRYKVFFFSTYPSIFNGM